MVEIPDVKKVTQECRPSRSTGKRVDGQERLIWPGIPDSLRPDIGPLPDIGDNRDRDTQLEYQDFPDIRYYVLVPDIGIFLISRYPVFPDIWSSGTRH